MRCTPQMVGMERKTRVTIHTKSGGLFGCYDRQGADA